MQSKTPIVVSHVMFCWQSSSLLSSPPPPDDNSSSRRCGKGRMRSIFFASAAPVSAPAPHSSHSFPSNALFGKFQSNDTLSFGFHFLNLSFQVSSRIYNYGIKEWFKFIPSHRKKNFFWIKFFLFLKASTGRMQRDARSRSMCECLFLFVPLLPIPGDLLLLMQRREYARRPTPTGRGPEGSRRLGGEGPSAQREVYFFLF